MVVIRLPTNFAQVKCRPVTSTIRRRVRSAGKGDQFGDGSIVRIQYSIFLVYEQKVSLSHFADTPTNNVAVNCETLIMNENFDSTKLLTTNANLVKTH